MDTEKLARDMNKEGMMLRWSAWDLKSDPTSKQYEYIPEAQCKNKAQVINDDILSLQTSGGKIW